MVRRFLISWPSDFCTSYYPYICALAKPLCYNARWWIRRKVFQAWKEGLFGQRRLFGKFCPNLFFLGSRDYSLPEIRNRFQGFKDNFPTGRRLRIRIWIRWIRFSIARRDGCFYRRVSHACVGRSSSCHSQRVRQGKNEGHKQLQKKEVTPLNYYFQY